MFLVYTEWWTATMTDLCTNKTGEKTTFITGIVTFKIIFLCFQHFGISVRQAIPGLWGQLWVTSMAGSGTQLKVPAAEGKGIYVDQIYPKQT